jgi:hypothetical protein
MLLQHWTLLRQIQMVLVTVGPKRKQMTPHPMPQNYKP